MHLNRVFVQRFRVDKLAYFYLLQLCKQVDLGAHVRKKNKSLGRPGPENQSGKPPLP